MKVLAQKRTALVMLLFGIFLPAVHASNLGTIGVTLLRATITNLNGSGIRVAQPEASAPTFEVNPAASQVNQPVSLFTYFSSAGTANTFPNAVGNESGHADLVAGNFYGLPDGVATNVVLVDNYDAGYFYSLVSAAVPADINDPVVNQSFIFCNTNYAHLPLIEEENYDDQFDNYAAEFNTLFVSGAGNGGPTNQEYIYPPASDYNGLGVAAYGGASCIGPTLDNGRCKPDITAPAGETSYSTPYVAGAAAILLQAGLRGDGGPATNCAADIRTLKALLLNGAVKPENWTNSNSSPLDARYGAGVVNIFNSYEQLAGGRHGYIVSTSFSTSHPPTGDTGTVSVSSGWDFNTNNSGTASSTAKHYYFDVTNDNRSATFNATATLVWNRHQGQTAINNLDLFLYNCANSNLVACSTSLVDNVEHIFLPHLPQGRYDLQVVMKAGGIFPEPYALAWAFSSTPLTISESGTNVNLTWPIYPDEFAVASATNLTSPVWSTNGIPPPIFTNGQNFVSVPATNFARFFRLQSPNF